MTPIRVLLADDHTLVRKGLRSLLEDLPEVEVVGEAGDGAEAVRLVSTLHPDIVLMDIAMPILNGLAAAQRITAEWAETRVVILSMNATEEYVFQALKIGVHGYLRKDADPPELELALRAVMRGDIYLSPAISRHLADYVRRTSGTDNPVDRLTPRQREVLRLIARGRSTKEIARDLGISGKTVATHRTQLMEQLGIHDLAGLVRYAMRIGLVEPEG